MLLNACITIILGIMFTVLGVYSFLKSINALRDGRETKVTVFSLFASPIMAAANVFCVVTKVCEMI